MSKVGSRTFFFLKKLYLKWFGKQTLHRSHSKAAGLVGHTVLFTLVNNFKSTVSKSLPSGC